MHSILRFCHLEETLVADALSVAARRRAVGQNYTEDAPGTVEGVPGYVIQRLEDSAIDYDAQFHKMMSMLLDQVCISLFSAAFPLMISRVRRREK